MGFSENFYNLRKNANISQKELADQLGVAQASINYWEKGQRTPSIDMVALIAAYFDVSIDYLMGFDKAFLTDSQQEPIRNIIKHINSIGYTFRSDSEGNAWIKYPDGKLLELDPNDLEQLNTETDSYLKFRLEELRKKKLNK